MDKFLILCAADKNRFDACVNHQNYADFHGLEYRFQIRNDIQNISYIKIITILEAFRLDYNKILCLDDDAFFVDFEWNCFEIFKKYHESLIVTRSPKKMKNPPLFNAGVIFLRKNKKTKKFLEKSLTTTEEELSNKWDVGKFGRLSGVEQPRLILNSFEILKDDLQLIDYPGFNGRRKNFAYNTPIVHFVSKNKETNIQKFQRKTGINLYELG